MDSDTHWAARWRQYLLVPGVWRWNGWVRGITGWLERHTTIDWPHDGTGK